MLSDTAIAAMMRALDDAPLAEAVRELDDRVLATVGCIIMRELVGAGRGATKALLDGRAAKPASKRKPAPKPKAALLDGRAAKPASKRKPAPKPKAAPPIDSDGASVADRVYRELVKVDSSTQPELVEKLKLEPRQVTSALGRLRMAGRAYSAGPRTSTVWAVSQEAADEAVAERDAA